MTAKQALQALGIVVDALPAVRQMLGVGSSRVDAGAVAASAALDAIIAGLDGSASPQEVLMHVEQLRAELAANDAAADSALDAKFKGGA